MAQSQNRGLQVFRWYFIAWLSIFFVIGGNLVLPATGLSTEEKKIVSKLRAKADGEFVSGKPKGPRNALTILNKVIKLEPDNHQNYYKRYRVNLRLKRTNKALRDLQNAVKVKDNFTSGWVQKAKLLRKIGRCVEAEADISRALQINSGLKSAQREREPIMVCAAKLRETKAAESRGDYKGADSALTKALEISSAAPDLFLWRARIRTKLELWWEVLADSGKTLKLDEGNLDALHIRANAYYRLGDHEMALRHQREGLRLAPENKPLKKAYRTLKKITKMFAQAERLSSEGKHTEAAEAFGTCVQIDPAHSEFNKKAWLAKCRVTLEHLKQSGPAREACDQALTIDGNYLDAQVLKAKSHAAEEDWEQAVREWKRAREIAGDGNADVDDGLRRAEAALKQSKEKDYYKILGVRRDASKREIKKAYRKLALEWHPDKHQGSEEEKAKAAAKFQDIGEANEVLTDDEKRAKFDRGEPVFENQGGGGGQRHGGFPFNFPGGGGGGGQQTFHFSFRL